MPSNSPQKLSTKQCRFLRKLAHHLKPIVIIGNAGLTDTVVNEIKSSIARHELLKIRINGADKATRLAMANQICQRTGSSLVLSLGHVVTIFRPAKKTQIAFPD